MAYYIILAMIENCKLPIRLRSGQLPAPRSSALQNKVGRLYRFESYIIAIVVSIAVLLNLTTFLYRSFTTPQDRYFAGTQFYSDDYAVYVSYIKQGQEGRWSVVDKFTSEPHPASFIHEEYLLWGKLTGFFGIQPVLAYHLSRAIFSIVFLILIYLLLWQLFPGPGNSLLRITSFFLICFGAGFLDKSGQPYLSWLTEMDVSQKFGSLLHYLLGFICTLGIFKLAYSDDRGKYNLLALLVLGFVGGFVLPSSLIVAITTLIAFACIQPREGKKLLTPVIILVAAGIPTAIYLKTIFDIPPWSHILAWEKINRGPFTFVQYLAALGPVAFMVPLGLFAWRQNKRAVAFLMAWIIAVFAWVFVFGDLFGFNPTRFLQSPVYIPLSLMAVLGLKAVFKNKNWLLAVAVLGVIIISLPTSIKSLKNHLRMYADYTELMYPGKPLMEAFNFLDKNTRPEEAVLSLYMAGNLTPFLSGNSVYLGHLQETIDYPYKVDKAGKFYSGLLPANNARDFLSSSNISLVFYSPQEKAAGGLPGTYSFLKPIFENETITIFRFIND